MTANERLAAARDAVIDAVQHFDDERQRILDARVDTLIAARDAVLAEGVTGLDFEAAEREGYGEDFNGLSEEAHHVRSREALNTQHRAIVGALRQRITELEAENRTLRANTSKSVLKRLVAQNVLKESV